MLSHSCPPILFLIFNRPNLAQQVFASIREAKPTLLFVAADGPRDDRPGEAEKCEQARRIIEAVDWDCEVLTLFREKNLGCGRGPSSAIDWFFEHVEAGVILEDDCVPHPDFFTFCASLLNRYENDTRVSVITGNNFQGGRKRGDAAYYFSKYNHVWGWATWRRAWQKNDRALAFWPGWKGSASWARYMPDKIERRYWTDIFDRMYRNETDIWDYHWTGSVWYHGGLTATPNVNLVTNIGFGPDGTHTVASEDQEGLPVHPLGPLTHPEKVIQDRKADRYVFDHSFGGLHKRLHRRLLALPRRIARKLVRSIFRS
ncbi:MAG: glycosyltransferase family 2 protein [Deltaproteobacteria bacterium]|nr:glycosyltransferase family 2 protein [Deltaproteobacteria bacterium]